MFRITLRNQTQNLELDHAAGPLELGRGPQRGTVARCFVDDATVSRDHLQVEGITADRVRVTSLSQRFPITLADGSTVPPLGSRELDLPLQLVVGKTQMVLARPPSRAGGSSAGKLHADEVPRRFETIPAPARQTVASLLLPSAEPPGDTLSPDMLARWMETVLALQRTVGSSAEFFDQAARALIDLIGLDVGLVLLYRDNRWEVVARAARDDDDRRAVSGREFSQTVLAHVLAERRTFFQDLDQIKGHESLESIDSVVASPIFGLNDEVVGALYGLGRGLGRLRGCKIRPLEAQMVQLLTAAVGANLARTTATRTRIQFEQFFSPELVRELERDPGLLEGRGQEVTILMSDIRGFSTLSEKLGPRETCRLVRDVMERQSERIAEHGGAIVSYLGDGILSMWNAPVAQPDHAIRACRAALAIQKEMVAASADWQPILGAPLTVGIGVNTGPVQVGNIGGTRKFMYGPLGNTVNLASRVEGATKHLNVCILVTGSTRSQLGEAFATRRLCNVRVVGIAEPVNLFELHGETAPTEWLVRRDVYERGLALFERRQWLRACQTLLPLLEQTDIDGPHDFPTLKLMRRSWACLESPTDSFEPVLDLASK